MVTGLDKPQALPLFQNPVGTRFEPIQVSLRNQSRARVRFNQLPNRADTVAHENRELLTCDAENVSFLLVWESIVENSGFLWPFHVPLKDERRGHQPEVFLSLIE
jgi:hypothetical protein